MTGKRAGLGRNLNALLGNTAVSKKTKSEIEAETAVSSVAVEQLQAGKYQPRQDMDQQALSELAESIKHQGIIQPIIARAVSDNRYEIIAGERRWRAAQMAGLSKVPVLIKAYSDETAIALALIENMQREDLSPMDEARGLTRLQQEFELSHQQIAELLSKSRAAVSNSLRLMKLHDDVKRMLDHGDLDMGHARALLSLGPEKQSEVARLVVARNLTVRETELLVKDILSLKPVKEKRVVEDPELDALKATLCQRLGRDVSIQQRQRGQGKLVIHYNNFHELNGIIDQIVEK